VRDPVIISRLDSATQAEGIDFQDLYSRSWRELCQFLRHRFGGGPPDPEDVAQSAFLKLAELKLESVANPQALLYRTAINLMIDQLRVQGRRLRHVNDETQVSGEDADPLANPERAALSAEQLGMLESVIRQLPSRHRSFFLANRLQNLSYAEIARRTGASQSMVRKVVEEALSVCHAAVIDGTFDLKGISRERHGR